MTEQRKQRGRKPPPELTSTSEISKFEVKSNFPALHSASVPGITCLDIHQNVLVTGGKDRNVVIFDKDQQEIIASCKGTKIVAYRCGNVTKNFRSPKSHRQRHSPSR